MNNPSLPVTKQPSNELSFLITTAAENLTDFISSWNEVRDKGLREGFEEKELQEMVRVKVRAKLESMGVEKPKIKNTIYYMFNQDKHAEKNKKAYDKTKSLINQTKENPTWESKDEMVDEIASLRTQLTQAKEDFSKASFDGKSTEDFLIVKRDMQSNFYLNSVTAVEAASMVKSLVDSGTKINIGWEPA